jgi:hypothetical protein
VFWESSRIDLLDGLNVSTSLSDVWRNSEVIFRSKVMFRILEVISESLSDVSADPVSALK